MNDSIEDKLIKEAKRIEEDCLYTSKGHYIIANYWHNFHLWIGLPTAIFSAIGGITILSKTENFELFAGILALIVAVLTSVITFLNPKEKENMHLCAGNQYNKLKGNIRRFLNIKVKTDVKFKELEQELEKLCENKYSLDENCPIVSTHAYKKAKKAIERGEAEYIADRMN